MRLHSAAAESEAAVTEVEVVEVQMEEVETEEVETEEVHNWATEDLLAVVREARLPRQQGVEVQHFVAVVNCHRTDRSVFDCVAQHQTRTRRKSCLPGNSMLRYESK